MAKKTDHGTTDHGPLDFSLVVPLSRCLAVLWSCCPVILVQRVYFHQRVAGSIVLAAKDSSVVARRQGGEDG